MSIELTCPFCSFSKTLSEKKIPATAKMAVCPRCHQKFPFSQKTLTTDFTREKSPEICNSSDPASPLSRGFAAQGIPGEKQEDPGVLKNILVTFKDVLFQPRVFFRTKRSQNGLKEPLAFGLLTGGLGDMLAFFWPVLIFSWGFAPFGESVFAGLNGTWIFLTLMIGIPIAVILKLFLYSGFLHLMLLLVRGGKQGFKATFSVVAYSQATLAWNIIPFMGSWIATVWQLIIQLMGLHEIHHISYARVIMAFLLPVFIFFAVMIMFLVPLLMFLF